MPARKKYTAEFKKQAVGFVLEELEPDESRKQAYALKLGAASAM